MEKEPAARRGFPWLEALLVLAVVAMVWQLFPEVGRIVLAALNPRNWPRTVWFAANVVIILVLLALRFGPQLAEDWRERRKRLAGEKVKQEKQQELKQQREAIERMQQAKRRRMY